MFAIIWHDFLYQPLFNLLIWMYNNLADQNLGWSIVYLTIILRFVLLPFTIVTERDKAKNMALADELIRIEKEFKHDSVLKKDEMRRVMKKRKIRPWAKAVVLGIQALVLVLLYQVFLQGITGEKMVKILYPAVDFPGKINIIFYGFDLSASYNFVAAGIVAVYLFLEIYINYKKRGVGVKKADLVYFMLFPIFVFIILLLLPMVKALFIFTSLIFSAIVGGFLGVLFKPKPKKVSK
jgi:membrane protein insertase Oxa1/YidC/SpoIIIJ